MRARNIKPGLYKNDALAECSLAARWLFTGLWCMADREGRLDDRPKRIKAEIFPYDDFDVDALLDELANTKDGNEPFIIRYEVDGLRYIQVVNFAKHQRPHSNEVESIIPPIPSDTEPSATKVNSTAHQGEQHGAPRESSRAPTDPGYLNDDSLIPDTGKTPRAPAREDATPAKPDEFVTATADVLVDAPFVADDLAGVMQGVQRSFALRPDFNPRDGPILAEKFANWRGYRKKPPKDWYQAWLNWLKKERQNDQQSHNGAHAHQRPPGGLYATEYDHAEHQAYVRPRLEDD